MAEIKFLSKAGLTTLWAKITALVTNSVGNAKTELTTEINKKVDAEVGKSLVSDELITRLDGVEDGAQANVIETVKVDGVALSVVDKAVDVALADTYATIEALNAVKTSVNKAYTFVGTVATKDELLALDTASMQIGSVYSVTSDPDGDGMNYAWTGTAWDALGGITDLSAYMKTADLVAITDEEIDTICV